MAPSSILSGSNIARRPGWNKRPCSSGSSFQPIREIVCFNSTSFILKDFIITRYTVSAAVILQK